MEKDKETPKGLLLVYSVRLRTLVVGVVGLDCLGDDRACRVTFLVVLALRCDRPRHVTTRCHYHARQNDCHND